MNTLDEEAFNINIIKAKLFEHLSQCGKHFHAITSWDPLEIPLLGQYLWIVQNVIIFHKERSTQIDKIIQTYASRILMKKNLVLLNPVIIGLTQSKDNTINYWWISWIGRHCHEYHKGRVIWAPQCQNWYYPGEQRRWMNSFNSLALHRKQ